MQITTGYAIISGNRSRSVCGEKQIGGRQHVRAVAIGNISEELVMEVLQSRSVGEGKDARSLSSSSQASSRQDVTIPLARVTTCGGLVIEVLHTVQQGPDGQPQPVYGPTDATWLARKSASTGLTLLAMLASQPHCFASKDWLSEKLGILPPRRTRAARASNASIMWSTSCAICSTPRVLRKPRRNAGSGANWSAMSEPAAKAGRATGWRVCRCCGWMSSKSGRISSERGA